MLEGVELALLREDFESRLPTSCTIKYSVVGTDEVGGIYRAWLPVEIPGRHEGQTVCRLIEKKIDERLISAEFRNQKWYDAEFPHGTPLTSAHKVVVNDVDYQVRGVGNTDSEALCVTAILMRVEGKLLV